jgi:hypothetical protein
MGKKVDGVSFDPQELFTYLINHLGLSDVAKTTQRSNSSHC